MMNDLPPWKEDPRNPTRKSGEKRKDKYGNEIKNVAKHLARKAMNSVKEAVFVSSRKKDLTAAKSEDTLVFDDHINCGTPDCCQTCDTADLGEASAFGDARRDLRRDSKGLAPTKRDEDDSESNEDPDEDKTPHLVSQLYKAVSINKPVKFKDGKSHTIAPHHAKKFINQYRSLKPADKEELQSKAHASHAEFKKAINEAENPAEETSKEYSAAKHKISITKSRSGHYTVTARFKNGGLLPSWVNGKVGKLSTATHARNAIPDAIEDLHNSHERYKRAERATTNEDIVRTGTLAQRTQAYRADKAKKAGAKLKMDPDTGTPDHFTAAMRRKKGLPEAVYNGHRPTGLPPGQGLPKAQKDALTAKLRDYDAKMDAAKKKFATKEEVELDEAGMPATVIKSKETIRNRTDSENKERFKGKSLSDLRSMAWRHGHGKGSTKYDKFHDGITEGSVKEELDKSNEWGTDALRRKYAAATPGQEGLAAKKIPTFDARYDDVPTRYIGGIQKEETLSEISAKGSAVRDDFRKKIQRAITDPANIARAKKVLAKKKMASKAAEADAPKNLVHQLHKSQSINAKVKFYDGKEHEIAPNHHDKFMNKYHGLKSSIEKESLVKRAHKSHEEFLKAIHEEFADFSQEKPNTDSITPANYPTPPMHNDMLDYNSDDRHDEYDLVAIENDVTAEIENAEWEDLVDYYDYEDLNYEDSDEDIAEGITPQGRLKKRFNMMRTKGRRNLARNMALKRVATPDRIKSRSVRAARNMVYSRVLRGRDRSSLSASEKTRLEGMVKRMAPMVGRLSIRLQQKERMIDRKRINNRNKRKKK
jgi:hypothetical protein